MLERIAPDRVEEWLIELNAPATGRDPDQVSEAVIDEEMALFAAFAKE
jgi:hypothetical protein